MISNAPTGWRFWMYPVKYPVVFLCARCAMAVNLIICERSIQSDWHSGSCVRLHGGTLKFGPVCVLCLKNKAKGGAQPENQSFWRRDNTELKAFRRPEGRKPYLLAFPLQITVAFFTSRLDIGKLPLHLVLSFLDLQPDKGTRMPVCLSGKCT